ncbi:MAG: ABC transporter permease, partial [Alphaproteobacteria bacterium]|nr:ABC transporter permease [Alphaproteobacteria bacterium]
ESTLGFTALVGAWLVSTNVSFGSGWFLPPVLVVIAMLAMGVAVGCFNSFFILKLRVNAFIVTLATLLALRGFTYVFTDANTMYDLPDSFTALGRYSIGGIVPLSVILFLGLFILSQFVLSYTSFGRDLYAIGGNREAAFAAGIRVDRRTLTAFILSGVLGALAAWVLAGRLQAATINLGQGMVFEVFAAAVIGGVSLAGGKGGMIGPLGGVLLLGVITTGLSVMPISSFWVDAVRGVVILVAVVLWRVTEIYEERWRAGSP